MIHSTRMMEAKATANNWQISQSNLPTNYGNSPHRETPAVGP